MYLGDEHQQIRSDISQNESQRSQQNLSIRHIQQELGQKIDGNIMDEQVEIYKQNIEEKNESDPARSNQEDIDKQSLS